MTEIKSISVTRELSDMAKDNKVSWSEAARVGMSMLLADLGVKPYDNNLNLKRKVDNLVHEIQRLHAERNPGDAEVNTE